MASDSFRDLYQDVIIDHSRERHGYGLQPDATAESHQRNRSCGDEITLQLHLDEAGTIASVRWEGQGCAISQASASMLSDLVTGLDPAEFAERAAAFRVMLRSRGAQEGSPELLDDAVALSGVAKYPARVKCAMLAWVALEDTLTQR